MDKAQPIRLNHFHENDGGRARNGIQQTIWSPMYLGRKVHKSVSEDKVTIAKV